MEKKSLEEAKHIAQKVSREYPEMIIVVMDKKGKKSNLHSFRMDLQRADP